MAIANTTPRQIAPTHPGAMLREDFMPDYGLTASTLATALGVSRQTIHELLRQEPRGHAADGVALVAPLWQFPHLLASTRQQGWDIWQSERSHSSKLIRIQPLPATM